MDSDRLRRRLRLRDLDTLMTVVESGGMRRAATRLHLSQPAVSKAIIELESALGVPLLHRSRRGVTPTPLGEALVARSKAAFAELRQAVEDIEHLSDPAGGSLRFGATEPVSAGIAATAIDRFTRRYPRMHFALDSGDSRHLLQHFLRERICEFVIARPITVPRDLDMHIEPLYRDQLRMVVGVEHPLAKRRRIPLSTLLDQRWILSPDEIRADSPIGRAMTAAGLPMPAHVMTNSSLSIRHSLLASGRFVTLMSHSLLHFDPRRRLLRVLPVEFEPWSVPTSICSLRDRRLGPVAERFLETLRELAADVPP